MSIYIFAQWVGLVVIFASMTVTSVVWGQAPGEDPVILTKKVTVQMLPIGASAPSSGLDGANNVPSWLRARIARYEAKAFAEDPIGVLTDNDVVTTANAQGMQKTCVQEVGSNTMSSSNSNSSTGSGKYGPNQQPQVVVLRGDLVNICK